MIPRFFSRSQLTVNPPAVVIPRHADNVRLNTSKSEAGAVLGSSKSAAKTHAAQANGAKGGRPTGS